MRFGDLGSRDWGLGFGVKGLGYGPRASHPLANWNVCVCVCVREREREGGMCV